MDRPIFIFVFSFFPIFGFDIGSDVSNESEAQKAVSTKRGTTEVCPPASVFIILSASIVGYGTICVYHSSDHPFRKDALGNLCTHLPISFPQASLHTGQT